MERVARGYAPGYYFLSCECAGISIYRLSGCGCVGSTRMLDHYGRYGVYLYVISDPSSNWRMLYICMRCEIVKF